jgi:hypothetical protein
MKYAVEMDSVAMLYIPSLVKIGSSIQKLLGGIHRHTDRKDGDRISVLYPCFCWESNSVSLDHSQLSNMGST